MTKTKINKRTTKTQKISHKSFRMTRGKVKKTRIKHQLPGILPLFRESFARLRQNWKVIGVILLIHTLLQFVFASGVTLSEAQVLYSLFFSLIVSLSYIWIFRQQAHNEEKVTITGAFYNGPFQFVPFLLLVLLTTVQAIPFIFGGWLFNIVVTGNIAIFYWEKLLFAGIWLVLTIPSAYWLATTLISLIVVAIPGVRPLEAWRATKKIVKPQISRVLWRLFVLFGVAVALLGVAVYTLISFNSVELALRLPTFANVVFLPLFWSFLFRIYTHLRNAS